MEIPTTMTAAYLAKEFITPGAVAPWVADAATPSAQPGYVVIKVHAASINPVDKLLGSGMFIQLAGGHGIPRSLGCDFAGEIVAVGEGACVTVLSDDGAISTRPALVGDVVFGDGIVGTGTFAEYAAVLASQVVIKPSSLSFTDAAAIPLAALTAYQAFLHRGMFSPEDAKPVGPGSKVLVLGGSGGVGSFAVQIAKALGAHVAATSSDTALLTSLGVDVPINYHEEDWGEKLKGQEYDFIFATVADDKPTPAHQRALGVLKAEGGCFICLLKTILPDPIPDDGRKWAFILTQSTRGTDLAELLQMVCKGKLKAVLNKGETFPFTAEGWSALMETSNSGRAKGKLVMKIV